MKSSVRFNRRLLTTATFDSGALGLLVHLIHRFPQAGTYQAVVLRDDQRVGTTCFRVTDQTAGTQLNIDLASVARRPAPPVPLPRAPGERARGVARGLRALPRPARHRELRGRGRRGEGGAQAVFDSRSLTDGDLFALALIEPHLPAQEPGRLGEGRDHVAPIPTGTDLRTVAPVYVDATSQGFQPAQVSVHAGQGIVFRARGATRIVITKRAAPKAARRGGPGRPRRTAGPPARARLAAWRSPGRPAVLAASADSGRGGARVRGDGRRSPAGPR